MICHLYDLGTIQYQTAWDLQNSLAAEIARGKQPASLLLLEHPHTYSFGRQGQPKNLLWNQKELEEHGASVHWVDRGGDVTYHGPGQLVGYPLMKLPGTDHIGYVRNLEKMLIAALTRLGLGCGQISGKTGIWVQADIPSHCPVCKPEDRQKPAKIAAIGVKVDANNITRHGFALNVNPDMSYFEGIIPCGISDYPVTSLAEIFSTAPEMYQVKMEIRRAFADQFNFELIEASI